MESFCEGRRTYSCDCERGDVTAEGSFTNLYQGPLPFPGYPGYEPGDRSKSTDHRQQCACPGPTLVLYQDIQKCGDNADVWRKCAEDADCPSGMYCRDPNGIPDGTDKEVKFDFNKYRKRAGTCECSGNSHMVLPKFPQGSQIPTCECNFQGWAPQGENQICCPPGHVSTASPGPWKPGLCQACPLVSHNLLVLIDATQNLDSSGDMGKIAAFVDEIAAFDEDKEGTQLAVATFSVPPVTSLTKDHPQWSTYDLMQLKAIQCFESRAFELHQDGQFCNGWDVDESECRNAALAVLPCDQRQKRFQYFRGNEATAPSVPAGCSLHQAKIGGGWTAFYRYGTHSNASTADGELYKPVCRKRTNQLKPTGQRSSASRLSKEELRLAIMNYGTNQDRAFARSSGGMVCSNAEYISRDVLATCNGSPADQFISNCIVPSTTADLKVQHVISLTDEFRSVSECETYCSENAKRCTACSVAPYTCSENIGKYGDDGCLWYPLDDCGTVAQARVNGDKWGKEGGVSKLLSSSTGSNARRELWDGLRRTQWRRHDGHEDNGGLSKLACERNPAPNPVPCSDVQFNDILLLPADSALAFSDRAESGRVDAAEIFKYSAGVPEEYDPLWKGITNVTNGVLLDDDMDCPRLPPGSPCTRYLASRFRQLYPDQICSIKDGLSHVVDFIYLETGLVIPSELFESTVVEGRYIRIEGGYPANSTVPSPINLAEIEVFVESPEGKGIVPLQFPKGSLTMSSAEAGTEPDNCIDGVTFYNLQSECEPGGAESNRDDAKCSYCSTNRTQTNDVPWALLDLGAMHEIKRITVSNRMYNGAELIDGASISIINDAISMETVWTEQFTGEQLLYTFEMQKPRDELESFGVTLERDKGKARISWAPLGCKTTFRTVKYQ